MLDSPVGLDRGNSSFPFYGVEDSEPDSPVKNCIDPLAGYQGRRDRPDGGIYPCHEGPENRGAALSERDHRGRLSENHFLLGQAGERIHQWGADG